MSRPPGYLPYTPLMDAVIDVAVEVRDRLAVLAWERGLTIRQLIAELARGVLTLDEAHKRVARAEAHLSRRVPPALDDEDLAGAENVWTMIEAGDIPEALPEPHRRAA